MNIDEQMVEKLSQLANIEISDEEKKNLESDLQAIVGFVDQLQEVNTEGIEETSQVTGLENVVRPDDVVVDAEQSDMLKTMPDVADDNHLRVHAVFTGDSPSN